MGRTHRWNASAFLRLNSFGTVRHHQDVVWLSFTVVHLSLLPFTVSFRETKNPASNREAGLGENFFSLRRCLLARIRIGNQPITGLGYQSALAEFTAEGGAIMTSPNVLEENTFCDCRHSFCEHFPEVFVKTCVLKMLINV